MTLSPCKTLEPGASFGVNLAQSPEITGTIRSPPADRAVISCKRVGLSIPRPFTRAPSALAVMLQVTSSGRVIHLPKRTLCIGASRAPSTVI